jgi:hypothetical protein
MAHDKPDILASRAAATSIAAVSAAGGVGIGWPHNSGNILLKAMAGLLVG